MYVAFIYFLAEPAGQPYICDTESLSEWVMLIVVDSPLGVALSNKNKGGQSSLRS